MQSVQPEVFSYDAVAYPAPILPYLTPDRLASVLAFGGFEAPDPQTASVLEIGCGEGLTLCGVASTFPQTRCVGFDLSEPTIRRGSELAGRAGLANVELHAGDILTWPRDGEKFDYVIAHGVHSWVPRLVQDALVELIAARLRPGGVAYVSYDCLPAVGPKLSINRYLCSMLPEFADPVEKVAAAHALVTVLAANQRKDSRLRKSLDLLLQKWPDFNPYYLFHDWISEVYEPSYSSDFAARAAVHGLSIIGDAGLNEGYLLDLDEAAQLLVRSTADTGERLELFDYLHGDQTFRRTLLVHADAPPARSSRGISNLRFAFHGERRTRTAENGETRVGYHAHDGAGIRTTGELEQAVMEAFLAQRPAEHSLASLSVASGVPPSELEALVRVCAHIGLLECHATPTPFVLHPGERPTCSPLMREMARAGATAVTPRMTRCELRGDATRALVVMCDGTRTRADILAEISSMSESPVDAALIDRALEDLARDGVFIA